MKMGGGHTSTPAVAPTPAVPTRSSEDTQALAAAQAKRYASPGSFVNTMLSGNNGVGLGGSSGTGSSLLGG